MRPLAGHDLRPLNAPQPIHVALDDRGEPHTITRQARIAHSVESIQDRWRIDDEWWREHAVARLYYVLILDDGARLNVYHDLKSDAWFEQHD